MWGRKGKSNPHSVTDNIEDVPGSSRHSSTNTIVQSKSAQVSGVIELAGDHTTQEVA
jgi:hypothetical protein